MDGVLDYKSWTEKLPELSVKYQNAHPFPHIVLDNFLNLKLAKQLEDNFPSPKGSQWNQYKHVNEQKLGQNKRSKIPELYNKVIDELNSPKFIAWLEKITGIKGLIPDPTLDGGGLHQIPKGGHLNMHADFTIHAHNPYWRRRVNVLVYLNSDWKDEYNGHIELWEKDMSKCTVKAAPILDRCVIFNTEDDSFHGHPTPLQTPDGKTRKSIALYYFTQEKEKIKPKSTNYQPRPEDSAGKSAAIAMDRWAVHAYYKMKRFFGISDSMASNVLGTLSKIRKKKE